MRRFANLLILFILELSEGWVVPMIYDVIALFSGEVSMMFCVYLYLS
jgi:hypothetical protein